MEDRRKQIEDIKDKDIKDKERAAALAFARLLRNRGLKPDEVTPEMIQEILREESEASKGEAQANTDNSKNEVPENEDSKEPEEVKDEASEKDESSKSKSLKKLRAAKERKPGAVSRAMTRLIDGFDRGQARYDRFMHDQMIALRTEYHKTVNMYKASVKSIGRSVITISLMCSMMMLVFEYFTVYEYAYNGRVLGYVDSQDVVTDVLDVAGEHLSSNNNMEVRFTTEGKDGEEGNITFRKVSSEGRTSDDADQVVNKLAYMSDIETVAYGIFEDGEIVAIVESEYDARVVMNEAKNRLSVTDKGMDLVSSEFKNRVEVKELSVMLASIQDDSTAINHLTEGGEFKIYHIINEDENLNTIAEDFGVTKADIYDGANSDNVTSYEIGDKVCIRKTIDPVQVEMVEEGTMSEVVKYKTIKKETNKMYKGDTIVRQEGVNGKQVITGKITKINGEVVDRNLTEQKVIKEVQNKIILVGTAKRPKTEPTGIFGNPLDPKSGYVITSRVGARWGRSHEGIDFGVRSGTPIYASDGGEVVISGVYGAYGYCIQIKHNDGYITRYGHCSQLLVSKGQKVYKGQKIALSGNTGRSTGPHLHFELRKNGAVIDPGPIIGVY